MRRKLAIFIVKQHVLIFCAFIFLFVIGFKLYNFDNPMNVHQQWIIIILIILVGLLLDLLFWIVFVKKNKTNMNVSAYKQILQYYCPACGQIWEDGNLPKDNICPCDGVPLKTFDPIEDKNMYPL